MTGSSPGKVAVVSGSTWRLGLAAVETTLRREPEGAVLSGRNAENGEREAARLRA